MRWVFRVLVAGLFVYESLALENESKGDTISEIVWKRTEQFPVVGFLAGFLAGHFFWQRRRDDT